MKYTQFNDQYYKQWGKKNQQTSIKETCNWNSLWSFKVPIFLNKTFITWGIIPIWKPSLNPVPMVYVFPEPVCNEVKMSNGKELQVLWHVASDSISNNYTWPYARTVALYPWNKPSTSGETHSSNMSLEGEPVLP